MKISADVEREFCGSPIERASLERAMHGMDRRCLDSESAIASFGGKSREAILESLRYNKKYGLAPHASLEEWALLYPPVLGYMAYAYVTFLLEQLSSDSPDGEYVAFFFFHFSMAIRINGKDSFTSRQYEILLNAATLAEDVSVTNQELDIYRDWILENIEDLKSEIKRVGG